MEREIKFRAFDKVQSTMHELCGLLIFKEFTEIYFGPSGFKRLRPQEVALMQATGLKDKNGVEIYEGDIVESKTLIGNQKIRGKVLFTNEGIWKVEEIHPEYSDKEYLYELTKDKKRTEVIGNVYQNPELLDTVLPQDTNFRSNERKLFNTHQLRKHPSNMNNYIITKSEKIALLENYSTFLAANGYMDSDWREEPPYAIDEFMKLTDPENSAHGYTEGTENRCIAQGG